MYINMNSGIILMPRGEDALKMRPVPVRELEGEKERIMTSIPVKVENARPLSDREEKALIDSYRPTFQTLSGSSGGSVIPQTNEQLMVPFGILVSSMAQNENISREVAGGLAARIIKEVYPSFRPAQ